MTFTLRQSLSVISFPPCLAVYLKSGSSFWKEKDCLRTVWQPYDVQPHVSFRFPLVPADPSKCRRATACNSVRTHRNLRCFLEGLSPRFVASPFPLLLGTTLCPRRRWGGTRPIRISHEASVHQGVTFHPKSQTALIFPPK